MSLNFDHLNNSDTAILVGEYDEHDPNHRVAFVNHRFTDLFGYTRADIPDKNSWWRKAYPDADYRQVVQRQWELLTDQCLATNGKTIEMEINITTKDGRECRVVVQAELPGATVAGHYLVSFTLL
ncbi:PAS domain-containing protein [Alteromonas halophila]|uniref:PAS fold-3 domain-containing protein n=1 Tax=Alteromonas halophila TaxID=516698 RepID=A0A918JJQ6_9ALTE|nr:PAS domain-containing protein [Alteromonas halophila]GGW83855.1 hypothetical protein GCM10007391_16820 [Alteromonas halophila]